MEENNEEIEMNNLVETFKKRGISCSDLKRKEEQRMRLAKEARQDGFLKTAEFDEAVASKLRQVGKRVCKLE